MWLAQLLADERGSPSSKRIVGVLCALFLCASLVASMFGHVPDRLLVETVTGLGLGALGLTSLDKRTPPPPVAPLLLLALTLTACQLGPRGVAAVATKATITALDGACVLYARSYSTEIGPRTDTAIAGCKGKGDAFPACVASSLDPWNRALSACEVYSHARTGAAKALDSDLGGVASEAIAALAAVGVEVK